MSEIQSHTEANPEKKLDEGDRLLEATKELEKKVAELGTIEVQKKVEPEVPTEKPQEAPVSPSETVEEPAPIETVAEKITPAPSAPLQEPPTETQAGGYAILYPEKAKPIETKEGEVVPVAKKKTGGKKEEPAPTETKPAAGKKPDTEPKPAATVEPKPAAEAKPETEDLAKLKEKIEALQELNRQIKNEREGDPKRYKSLLEERKQLALEIDGLYKKSYGITFREKVIEVAKEKLKNREFNGIKMKTPTEEEARQELTEKFKKETDERFKQKVQAAYWEQHLRDLPRVDKNLYSGLKDPQKNRLFEKFVEELDRKRQALGMSEDAFNWALRQGYSLDQIKEPRLILKAVRFAPKLIPVPGLRKYLMGKLNFTKVVAETPTWANDTFTEKGFDAFKERMEEEAQDFKWEVKNRIDRKVNEKIERGKKIFKKATNKYTPELLREIVEEKIEQAPKTKTRAKVKASEKQEPKIKGVKTVQVNNFDELFEVLESKEGLKYKIKEGGKTKEVNGDALAYEIKDILDEIKKDINDPTKTIADLEKIIDEDLEDLPKARNIRAKVKELIMKEVNQKRNAVPNQPKGEAAPVAPEAKTKPEQAQEQMKEISPDEILRILKLPKDASEEDIMEALHGYSDRKNTPENDDKVITQFADDMEKNAIEKGVPNGTAAESGLAEKTAKEFIKNFFGIKEKSTAKPKKEKGGPADEKLIKDIETDFAYTDDRIKNAAVDQNTKNYWFKILNIISGGIDKMIKLQMKGQEEWKKIRTKIEEDLADLNRRIDKIGGEKDDSSETRRAKRLEGKIEFEEKVYEKLKREGYDVENAKKNTVLSPSKKRSTYIIIPHQEKGEPELEIREDKFEKWQKDYLNK